MHVCRIRKLKKPLESKAESTGLWSRRAIAQCAVWSFRVVKRSPLLNQDLRLVEAIEDFPVQHFIAKAGVEALAIPILPRRSGSGLNVSRHCPDGADPVPNGQGYELWAVVGTDEGGNAPQDEQIGQRIGSRLSS